MKWKNMYDWRTFINGKSHELTSKRKSRTRSWRPWGEFCILCKCNRNSLGSDMIQLCFKNPLTVVWKVHRKGTRMEAMNIVGFYLKI